MFVGLVIFCVAVSALWRSATWWNNAPETSPAAYAPLVISEGENEDIDRVIQRLYKAKTDRSLIDETVTENVFNGIVDKINKGEKAKGHKTVLEDLRVGFEGEHLHVAFTKPKKSGQRESGRPLYQYRSHGRS